MINRMLCGLAALFGALVMALGLAVGTASAEEAGHYPAAGWEPLDNGTTPAVDSSIVNSTTVELVVTEEGSAGPASRGTSVETTDLGLEVPAGAKITFRHETLAGAGCGANNVRAFVIIDGVNTNSWDQLQPSGNQCGTEGLVTFTVANGGTISHAGLVMDNNPPDPGTVRIWDLTVDGTLVLFQAPASPSPDTPDPSPTPTAEPTETPDPGATQTPDPSATKSPEAATLPQTSGVRLLPVLLIGGLVLIGAGAGAYYATRRKMGPTL